MKCETIGRWSCCGNEKLWQRRMCESQKLWKFKVWIFIFISIDKKFFFLKKNNEEKNFIAALVTVLSLMCASQVVLAQMRPNPCDGLPGGTGNVYFHTSPKLACLWME
jgi:hypothetical protein